MPSNAIQIIDAIELFFVALTDGEEIFAKSCCTNIEIERKAPAAAHCTCFLAVETHRAEKKSSM